MRKIKMYKEQRNLGTVQKNDIMKNGGQLIQKKDLRKFNGK